MATSNGDKTSYEIGGKTSDVTLKRKHFWGHLETGKVSEEEFEGAFRFLTNFDMSDFTEIPNQFFPEEYSIKRFLGSIVGFYTHDQVNGRAFLKQDNFSRARRAVRHG